MGLSSLTAMCLFGTVGSAYASYNCDVNGDGSTNIADALCIQQYIRGNYNLANPEVADFNNDGFVNYADALGVQYLGIKLEPSINDDYTPSRTTQLRNSDITYKRYKASTGADLNQDYTVEAAPTIDSTSSRTIIGDDDRKEADAYSGLCKIVVSDGDNREYFNGFVASNNSILTAASNLKDKKIISITLYNNNTNKEVTLHPIDYSIPTNYVNNKREDYNYALITVSDDLSPYNNFYMGYALQRAFDINSEVNVTAYQSNGIYTGTGNIKGFTYGVNISCDYDAGDEAIGAPIYANLTFDGEEYKTVIGIHSSNDFRRNSGVRMCPNITHLVTYNLN